LSCNYKKNNDFRDNGSYGNQFTVPEYQYDYNGNMIFDANKNIQIQYNFLDLPERVTQQNDLYQIEYMYTAGAAQIQTKEYKDKQLIKTTDYCGQFVYIDKKLSYIMIDGARIKYIYDAQANNQPIPDPTGLGVTQEYEFYLTDHLGNVRVVFNEDKEIVQENDYYPCGLLMFRL